MSQSEQPKTPQAKPVVHHLSLSDRLEGWYENNGKLINGVLVVLLVGVIGYQLYRWQNNRALAGASSAYNQAFTKVGQANSAEDDAKQDAYLGAVTAAEAVTEDYGDNYLGRRAQLLAANSYYNLATQQSAKGVGKGKETLGKARDAFARYVEIAVTPQEKAAGHLGLGNVLEDLSFIESNPELLKEAVQAYKQAESLGKDSHLAGQAQLALGRVYTAYTDKSGIQQAAQVLEGVASESPVIVSSTTPESAKEVKLADGRILSPYDISQLRNFAKWSYRQVAQDALSRLK